MVAQTNKTNPNAPDWKCSDPNCKKSYNWKTKEWEDSKYITGAWNPKPKGNTVSTDFEDRLKVVETDLEKVKQIIRDRWNAEIN